MTAADRNLLLASMAYAAVVLVVALTCHPVGGYGVETDFYGDYVSRARDVQDLLLGKGGVMRADPLHGPVYPCVLAIGGLLLGDFFRAGVVIAGLSAGAALYLTGRIFRKVVDPPWHWLCLAFVAANVTFIRYSYEAGTDMLYMLLVTAASLCALRAVGTESAPEPFPRAFALLAGALAGLSFLTRQNGIALGLGFLGVVLVTGRRRGAAAGSLRLVAAFGLGALGVCAPWLIYEWRLTGRPVVSQNQMIVARGLLLPDQSWDEFAHKSAARFTSLRDIVAYDPGTLAANLALNLPRHLWGDLTKLMSPVLGAFAASGMAIHAARRSMGRRQAAFLILGLAQFAVLLPLFYWPRFALSLVPFYAVLALPAFRWLVDRAGSHGRRVAWAVIGLGALIAVLQTARTIGDGPKEVFSIRDRFSAAVPSRTGGPWEEKICARKPHLGYYLRMVSVGFPYVDRYDELIDACRGLGAAYLYYGRVELKERPQFRGLLDPGEAHAGLEPIVVTRDPPSVLYRITGAAPDR